MTTSFSTPSPFDQLAIERFLIFLYTSSYDTLERGEELVEETAYTIAMRSIPLCALGDVYDITSLKDYAVVSFMDDMRVLEPWHSSDTKGLEFVHHTLPMVYSITPASDRALRVAAMHVAKAHLADYMYDEKFMEAMERIEDLGNDVRKAQVAYASELQMRTD